MNRRSFFGTLSVTGIASVIAAPVVVKAREVSPYEIESLPGSVPEKVIPEYNLDAIVTEISNIGDKVIRNTLLGSRRIVLSHYPHLRATQGDSFNHPSKAGSDECLKIDKHIEATFLLPDITHLISNPNPQLLEMHINAAAIALGERMIEDAKLGSLHVFRLSDALRGTGAITKSTGLARAIISYSPARLQNLVTLDVLYAVRPWNKAAHKYLGLSC